MSGGFSDKRERSRLDLPYRERFNGNNYADCYMTSSLILPLFFLVSSRVDLLLLVFSAIDPPSRHRAALGLGGELYRITGQKGKGKRSQERERRKNRKRVGKEAIRQGRVIRLSSRSCTIVTGTQRMLDVQYRHGHRAEDRAQTETVVIRSKLDNWTMLSWEGCCVVSL